MTDLKVEEFEETIKDDVNRLGFDQYDKHLDRNVRTLSGHFVVLKDPDLFSFYLQNRLNPKFEDDARRMRPSFWSSVYLAKEDPSSRQLMVFNDSDYSTTKQCFTHMQFILTGRNEYDLYVYQRSGDVSKFRDDMTFFVNNAKSFQEEVGFPVTKIVVIYGSIHFTKE
jgi:hypothetical protein